MKKGKLLLLLVTSALTFGSLVGCNVSVDIKSEESSNSADVSSNPASPVSSSSRPSISSSEAGNNSSQSPASSEATSSGAASSQTSDSSEAVTYDWSTAELAIFKDHLYDYYLPHPNKPGVTLTVLEGVSQGVMIGGCIFLEGELAAYASQYRAMYWAPAGMPEPNSEPAPPVQPIALY